MENLIPDVRALFCAALDQKTPAEVARYLDAACGGDAGLRAQVEELLASHRDGGKFLGGAATERNETLDQTPDERPGTQIGPFKLLQQIGEGGMGVVYMAEQTAPLRRKVALKVLKLGMDTRQVIARFEAERQALAVMDHPNIARVLDAGTVGERVRGQVSGVTKQDTLDLTPDSRLLTPGSGRPYFVMELVKGVPITQYCDEQHLTVRQRLELFLPVCQAIQHAHQKGIIHRDIKPTNVLVALYDGQPVPKVIDFGVAKATAQRLTEKTMFTQFGQLVGTLEYMSPEQAQLNQLDIDTRSDIYSLGVLLYELLTGRPPHSKKEVQRVGMLETLRMIREQDPTRPSAKLNTADALPTLAANRGTEPAKLTRLVRGELDWIVMKALEKDRNRRYETASALAADLQRYLHHEPVLACPPSRWYRLRKLVGRNWGAFLAAAAMIVLLVSTIVTLAVSNAWIRQEQARTNDEKARAERALTLAKGQAEEIRQGLQRLKAANAWLEKGRWFSGHQRWDDAGISFTKAVELRPDHAAAWVERGELYVLLGLWDMARADFDREFELRTPDATSRWYRLAVLRLYLGDTAGYRRISQEMRERFGGTHDMDFATEVVRASVLTADAELDLRPLLEHARQAHLVRPWNWYEQYVLGIVEFRAGHFAEAVERLQGSLKGDPPWEARALNYPVLAMALHRLNRTAEADAALQSAAEAFNRWTSERYGHTGRNRWIAHFGATAKWPVAWWDWLECQVFYREAHLLINGSPPPEDPRELVLRARALGGMRKNFAAEVEYAAAFERMPDDAQVRAEVHRNSAYAAIGRQQWHQATDEFSKARELMPNDAALSSAEAVAALAAGDVEAYRRTCSAMLERLGEEQDKQTANEVVWACVLRGDSVADFDRLLALARIAALSHYDGAGVLLAAQYRAGNFAEAIACFETATRMYRPTAWDWTFAALAHHRLGHADEARRCLAEASDWIHAADRHTDIDLSGALPSWGSWRAPIAYRILLREANQTIKNDTESGRPE